jgi:hypothetical protein
MKTLFGAILVASLTLVLSPHANAWGKRGHSIVCETAAYLTAEKAPKAEFMKSHSFDLGYYCNVPDLVWKKGDLYDLEWFNHFMDMEIFDRVLKGEAKKEAFEMDRLAFNTAHPEIKESAGRAFWRIRELLAEADKLKEDLKRTDLSQQDRQKMQGEWLIRIGTLGHYVGDLSQPLHVTENYDGQMTDQKGIHAWFEDELVDQLFFDNGPGNGIGLERDVMNSANLKWKKLNTLWNNASPSEVLISLSEDSNHELVNLLKLDKKIGRTEIKKAAHAFRAMIVDRLATGAVALSTLWNRELGWDYDGKKFYFFGGAPLYITYPRPAATPGHASSPTPTPTPSPH